MGDVFDAPRPPNPDGGGGGGGDGSGRAWRRSSSGGGANSDGGSDAESDATGTTVGTLTSVDTVVDEEQKMPKSFFCSMGKVLMTDPVILADGYSYERSAIEAWLADYTTSPVTGQKLAHKDVIPNISLRQSLEEWQALAPERRRARQEARKKRAAARAEQEEYEEGQRLRDGASPLAHCGRHIECPRLRHSQPRPPPSSHLRVTAPTSSRRVL